MRNADLYFPGPDGTLWTRVNGVDRRPSTVEELQGFCLQRLAKSPPARFVPRRRRPAGAPAPVAMAV